MGSYQQSFVQSKFPFTLSDRVSSNVPDFDRPTVYVVDDDHLVRDAVSGLLESIGVRTMTFASISEFQEAPSRPGPCCLVLDVRLRGQSGLAFQARVVEERLPYMPIVFMSAYADIPMTVKAMKAGAVDFLAKPFREQELIDAVNAAIDSDIKRLESEDVVRTLRAKWETLTVREREVMAHLATGLASKQIASVMGVAEITANIHRGHAMRKMQVRNVVEVVHIMQALAGAGTVV